MQIDDQTRALIKYLSRGGSHGYWWYASEARDERRMPLEKATVWWPCNKPGVIPPDRGRQGARHLYFGVHPTIGIPQERTGQNNEVYKPKPEKCRPLLDEIAAINCLFAEFDAKRYAGDKAAALAHIEALEVQPSVIIDSGGGYHVYWLLDTPYVLDSDDARSYARRLQYGWVVLVESDDDAKDLSRVLRIPGTRNYKEAYGPNYPVVAWVRYDMERVYSISKLEDVARPYLVERTSNRQRATNCTDTPLTEYERVEEALERINADRWASYQGWIDIGMALYHWDSGFHGLSLWERFSRYKSPNKWEPGTCEAKWATFQPKDITIASVFHWAQEDTPRDRVYTARDKNTRRPAASSLTPADYPMDTPKPEETPAETLPILLRASELHRIPPAQELIPNLLYINTLHQMFGAAGGGKSFLALDIAATTAQHRPVVYIAAEAIEDYEDRLDAWQAHHGHEAGDLYFWRQPLALADDRAVRQFILAVEELNPALIVLDPLADCMTGLDENNPKDMSLAIFALNTIRRHTHAAVLVVHHTGWNTDHERGHSVLRAACRVVVKVEARDDGLIRFVCEKKNHGRKFDPRSFRLVAAGSRGGALPLPARMVMPGKLRLNEKLLRVMEAMTTEPLRKGATHTDLLKDTAIPAGTLNRILTALVDADYIRAEDNGRSRVYKLTTTGKDALDMAFEEQSDSWNASGRTLEELGRAWNWEVASSTVSLHNNAVLPNSSNSLPLPPISLPPMGGDIGVDSAAKVLPRPEGNGYRPEVPLENTVKGYREFLPEAEQVQSKDALFPDEPSLIPVAQLPRVGFNLDTVRALLQSGNVAGLSVHYRLHRGVDVRGLSAEDIIELAEREAVSSEQES
jgi:predicted transcriptional regulator